MRHADTSPSISRFRPLARSKLPGLFAALWFSGVLCFSAGCAQNTSSSPGTHVLGASASFAVFFASSVSYAQALRELTNLGLVPALYCGTSSNEGLEEWQPMGQRDAFLRNHLLFIWPGYLTAPTDWRQRLQTLPDVRDVRDGFAQHPWDNGTQPADLAMYQCPPGAGSTPTSNAPVVLNAANVSYVAVTFAKPGETYDTALSLMVNLGLQLTDPCYVRSSEQGATPPWHPMSQEDSFAATSHLIVLAYSGITSAQWQELLRASPGVTSAEVFTPQC